MEDSALPAFGAIRSLGLAGALPGLALTDGPVELRLCNYVVGSRATFEARAGGHRLAVKLYAEDPSLEAELYQRLARVGLARPYGARVPQLLAWDPRLRVLALSWLEGPTADHLIKEGKGLRAGQLAASWLWHAFSKRVRLGPPRGRGRMLYKAGKSTGALGAFKPALGAAAKRVGKMLMKAPLRESPRRLVHGTFYARHILDLDGVPGVIDWNQFGQGPVELDAGMFLATISRLALRHPSCAHEVERAKESFLERVGRLVDFRSLEWYWSAGLMHLAGAGLKTARTREVPEEASSVIDEAERHASNARKGISPEAPDRSRWASRARATAPIPSPRVSVGGEGPNPPDARESDRRE